MKNTAWKIFTIIIPFMTLLAGVTLSSCKKQGKDIGIQLWSVRDAMKTDPEGTLAKLSEIGYTFIEAAGYSDGLFYGMEPEKFRSLVEKNDMLFISSHTGKDLPDSSTWDATMLWWDECIVAHRKAGVKFIVQPWMGNLGYESLEGLKAYCDYFNTVGEKCNALGIRFGYHNHDGEFQLSGDSINTIYDYMLQHTDSDKVMFQLDVFWVVVGGKDPVDYFKAYPGRFELLHIKDKEELGASGTIDFEPYFNNLELAGTKHYIVEVEHYNYEPLESVKRSFDYLNGATFVP